MKKKIMHALKKQQAEQPKSKSESEEITSCARSGVSLDGETDSKQQEVELLSLRAEFEEERASIAKKLEEAALERDQLREAKLQDERKIEQLSKANEGLEAQLLAAAKQLADAFSQISDINAKLEDLRREKDASSLAYTNLSEIHERFIKELEEARRHASVKEQEREQMLASHKATQEGQEAAISQLMQQLQSMEASVAAQPRENKDEGSVLTDQEILLQKLHEQSRTIESLQFKITEMSNIEEGAKMKAANDGTTSPDNVYAGDIVKELDECRKRIKDLENDLVAARETASGLAAENTNLTKQFGAEKKGEEKYAELDVKYTRLQKRAKQRIQELQKDKEELEGQVLSLQEKEKQASEKQISLQNDLDRFRAQAGDAIRALDSERQSLRTTNLKLKEELDDAKRFVDSKDLSLAESRRLASEKDQAVLTMQAEMKEAEVRHEAGVADLNEKHNKVVEGLQSQLNEAASEIEKQVETVKTLQEKLSEKESKLADAEAALTGEVARLSAAAEAAKVEAARVAEEQENERKKWISNVGSLSSKIRELENAYQRLEVASAESKRRLELEAESMQSSILNAQEESSLAKDEVSRITKEFAAYKARAHALLQKKELELQSAKDVDLAAAQEANLKDAQRQAAAAAAERDRAVNALKHAVADYETQLAARNVAILDTEHRIKELATKLESTKALLASEREDWQKHSQDLDSSWREKYEELAKRLAHPAEEKLKNELSALAREYERLKEEFESYRDMADKILEVKDNELAKLLEDNNNLQKSLSQEVKAESVQSNNYIAVLDDEASVVAVAEQQILLLARQQAQREEELKHCQREIDVLQEEIADLERENRLRAQQEAMLKEELRNMERASTRNGVDMTYLKNVILKLLETGEVEALLPVVGTLLQFSPNELKRCQEAYTNADPADTPRSLLSRLSFGSGK